MSKDPAFLFYTSDYLEGTRFMSREEKGCYVDLLCVQHQHGHLSLDQIISVLGVDYERCWSKVSNKFVKDENGLYYNERLEKEMHKRADFSFSRKENKSKYIKICLIKIEENGYTIVCGSSDPEKKILKLRGLNKFCTLSILFISERIDKSILYSIWDKYKDLEITSECYNLSDKDINNIKTTFLFKDMLKISSNYDSDYLQHMENRNENRNSINSSVFKEGGCKEETKYDEFYESFKKAYPDNGSAISEEVRRQIRSFIVKGIPGELITSRAKSYAEFCVKQYPSSYPYEKHICRAINWLRGEQYNVDWEKMTSEVKKTEMGTHFFN